MTRSTASRITTGWENLLVGPTRYRLRICFQEDSLVKSVELFFRGHFAPNRRTCLFLVLLFLYDYLATSYLFNFGFLTPLMKACMARPSITFSRVLGHAKRVISALSVSNPWILQLVMCGIYNMASLHSLLPYTYSIVPDVNSSLTRRYDWIENKLKIGI